jgi:hypothetical protein
MSGTSRFVYPPCGCVFSEEALKEVKADGCLVCGKTYQAEDIIPIHSTDSEEVDLLRSRMDARQSLRETIEAQKKAAKAKAKKRKSDVATEEPRVEEIKKKSRVDTHTSNINMNLPNLSDPSLLPPGMRVQSEAVKSLFVKKDKDGKVIEQKNNFLVRGTFNRFAASF